MFTFNSRTLHEKSLKDLPFYAKFTGSTAIVSGQLLCYDVDRGTLTAVDGNRCNYVEVASTTNNRWPAGYATQSYPAVTGGQVVQLFAPGSVCRVSILEDATACTAGAPGTLFTAFAGTAPGSTGLSIAGRLPGAGSAEALQTVTVQAHASCKSIDGTATFTGTTLTKTGVGSNAVVGDEVHFVAGITAGTGVTAATPLGKQTVLTLPLTSTLTVGTSIGTSLAVAYYVRTGNKTAMCMTHASPAGQGSGLIEFRSPTTSGTTAAMIGGATNILGGITIAADDVVPLTVGTQHGQLKNYKLNGTITTQDYLVTPTTTTAIQADGTTTLASLEFDGDADECTLMWAAGKWRNVNFVGVAQA